MENGSTIMFRVHIPKNNWGVKAENHEIYDKLMFFLGSLTFTFEEEPFFPVYNMFIVSCCNLICFSTFCG